MQIQRLKLLNFRGFASCEVDLDPHFNLIVGDNATGKTSILDAISIALDGWFLGLKGVKRPAGIHPHQVRVIEHRFADSASFEKQFPTRIQASGIVLGQEVTWSRELSREGGKTTSSARALTDVAAQVEAQVRNGDTSVDLPLLCSYGTERLWFESPLAKIQQKQNGQPRLPSRLDGYKDSNAFQIQESALLEWIKAEVSVTLQRGTETLALSVIKKAIASCVEDAKSIYYDERVQDLIVVMRQRGHQNSNFQMFRFLSDGQRIMLTLVGDLVKRAVTLNPHLGKKVLEQTRGVVVIDELDLHLHPKWQRRVIHDLKRTFPAIQFIATTHSPQLIGEALPHEIRVLDDGGVFIPSRSFGIDSSRTLEEVMHASARNPAIQELLSSMSTLIDQEKLEDAKEVLEEVRAKLGEDDPDVTGASTLISLLESTQ